MSARHHGENINSLLGEALLGARSDAVAFGNYLFLAGRDDMAPVGVDPHRQDTGIEIPQRLRVVQLEAGIINHLLLGLRFTIVVPVVVRFVMVVTSIIIDIVIITVAVFVIVAIVDVHIALLLAQILPVER